MRRLPNLKSSIAGEVTVNADSRTSSTSDEYHCATPLNRMSWYWINYARPKHNATRGGCQIFLRLGRATILALVSHILMYREGYHLCSRFDSYLGRCSRGGARISILIQRTEEQILEWGDSGQTGIHEGMDVIYENEPKHSVWLKVLWLLIQKICICICICIYIYICARFLYIWQINLKPNIVFGLILINYIHTFVNAGLPEISSLQYLLFCTF